MSELRFQQVLQLDTSQRTVGSMTRILPAAGGSGHSLQPPELVTLPEGVARKVLCQPIQINSTIQHPVKLTYR